LRGLPPGTKGQHSKCPWTRRRREAARKTRAWGASALPGARAPRELARAGHYGASPPPTTSRWCSTHSNPISGRTCDKDNKDNAAPQRKFSARCICAIGGCARARMAGATGRRQRAANGNYYFNFPPHRKERGDRTKELVRCQCLRARNLLPNARSRRTSD
jgi:hypothetical protein